MVSVPRRGSVAVEFGLLVPILLVLVGGATNWGWALTQEVALVQVARDAALAGARTESSDGPDIIALARAQEGLTAAGFDLAASTITVTQGAVPTGATLQVRIETNSEAFLSVVPLPEHLSAATTARLDYQ
jgi:Flp pilus assembly protein TadG